MSLRVISAGCRYVVMTSPINNIAFIDLRYIDVYTGKYVHVFWKGVRLHY